MPAKAPRPPWVSVVTRSGCSRSATRASSAARGRRAPRGLLHGPGGFRGPPPTVDDRPTAGPGMVLMRRLTKYQEPPPEGQGHLLPQRLTKAAHERRRTWSGLRTTGRRRAVGLRRRELSLGPVLAGRSPRWPSSIPAPPAGVVRPAPPSGPHRAASTTRYAPRARREVPAVLSAGPRVSPPGGPRPQRRRRQHCYNSSWSTRQGRSWPPPKTRDSRLPPYTVARIRRSSKGPSIRLLGSSAPPRRRSSPSSPQDLLRVAWSAHSRQLPPPAKIEVVRSGSPARAAHYSRPAAGRRLSEDGRGGLRPPRRSPSRAAAA